MSNLDKKIICVLLIMAMLLVSFANVASAVVDINSEELTATPLNQEVELVNGYENVKFYYDHILTANGDLYEIDYKNPTAKMKKVDSNVSKYVYSHVGYSIYLKGNTAVAMQVDKYGNKSTKTISNVKDVATDFNGSYCLTNDNELYSYRAEYKSTGKDTYIITDEWKNTKVDSGMDKIVDGLFYYKDGQTYSLLGTKVYDGKIDKGYSFLGYRYVLIGEKLYSYSPYSNYSSDFYKNNDYSIVKSFDHFEYNNYLFPVAVVGKDGTKKDIEIDFRESQDNMKYKLEANNTAKSAKGNVVNNVKAVSRFWFADKSDEKVKHIYYCFFKADGTVWCEDENGNMSCIYGESIKFNDVSTKSWFYNAVSYVFSNNIIKGYNSTTFAPNDKLTRGMLVTIIYRMEGEPQVQGAPKFRDVQNRNQFYYKAVKWATDNNIISGYNTELFGPEDNITREQLAIILNKYAKYKVKNTNTTNDLKEFKDTNKISNYAKSAMQWAVGAGVISGNADKTLKPKGYTTRAEASAMLEKYCNKIGR